jgi:hypothetical protein
MKKWLILTAAGAAVLLAAGLLFFKSRSEDPRPLVRACDVLTEETARSLLGEVSRGNDDNDELSTRCQYLTDPAGGSIDLSAQRHRATEKADAVQRARRDVRSQGERGTSYPGLGDEAYLLSFEIPSSVSPSGPAASGSMTTLTTRVRDLRVTASFNGEAAPEQALAAVDRLTRDYLARTDRD